MSVKIFIDQGHNPKNPNSGAEGNGYQEAVLMYPIGIMLKDMLNGTEGFEAITSRNAPDEILGTSNSSSLAQRANAANAWGADYFISLHANASTNSAAKGSEGYVYSLSSKATGLARSMLEGLFEATGTVSRGVFARPTLYVLRKTKMPATLLELGFITNPEQARAMADEPQKYAMGLYDGIRAYF